MGIRGWGWAEGMQFGLGLSEDYICYTACFVWGIFDPQINYVISPLRVVEDTESSESGLV